MNDGKPNWWSRPSTPPEAARIPTPSPAEEGDFPLQAPDPAESAVPEPAAEAPAAPTVDMTKEPAASEPTPSAPAPAVTAPAEPAPAGAVTAAEPVP
ncbi:protease, partial [Streptomyces hydrogenans]